MISVPKNPPIDIRALILYDNSQWKTAEKSYNSYEKLCETSGNVAISYEDYEYYFNEYLKEAYYSARNKSQPPVTDIRCCILSDVVNGKPAEKSLIDLCEAFGFIKINKEEHGYWYKRYKYTRHPSTPLQFSDLPIDVVSEIVEKCDLETHLNLRNVSYGLRTVVDQKRPACTKLYTVFVDYGIGISHDFLHLPDPRGRNQQKMFRELEFLLRNPKLRLKQLSIKTGLSESINFESYTMKARERLDTDAIKEALNLQETTSPGIYSIPNSNLVIEFSWGSRVLKLSKYSV
ncbi:hypothetical protein GCK72_021036 [Caenorhabditis remanei]|uniref:F-box domain-containing protein n=1 Tax=Caenorhabditis remanei TaxID=31234 RepID=A0A6A5GIG8_CAERE|nr:hypothetical protein GCK72_021036 [Caenorhabditis remanei]KAF1754473.1 hypothetical protein GCK72_021036 [Caenorhabditis remanei]